jgi:Zn-dependent metalloprotease
VWERICEASEQTGKPITATGSPASLPGCSGVAQFLGDRRQSPAKQRFLLATEHVADVFGVLVRQWRRGESAEQASWIVGHEVLVPAPTRRGIRDMEHPGDAYRNDPYLGTDPQPDHMDRIYKGPADSGGVHINSGIPNRAFVIVAKALGGNAWESAGEIWYEAMFQLSRTSQFADLAKITAQIAGDRFGAAAKKAVRAGWKKVGL